MAEMDTLVSSLETRKLEVGEPDEIVGLSLFRVFVSCR
jgi:hypothetical protein